MKTLEKSVNLREDFSISLIFFLFFSRCMSLAWMDDDVKKIWTQDKPKRLQSEWSHQSAMHYVSSPE